MLRAPSLTMKILFSSQSVMESLLDEVVLHNALLDLLLSSQTLALLKGRKKNSQLVKTRYTLRRRDRECVTGETGLCLYESSGVTCHSKND